MTLGNMREVVHKKAAPADIGTRGGFSSLVMIDVP
jgi:hypothetical protein